MPISTSARATIKRVIPTRARRAFLRLRGVFDKPPIDDVVLAQYRLQRDDAPRTRLNLVMSNLTRSTAFGGVTTGIDIVLQLARRLGEHEELDVRLIIGEPNQETDATIFGAAAARLGIDEANVTNLSLRGPAPVVPVRARDVFVTYNAGSRSTRSILSRPKRVSLSSQRCRWCF